MVEQWGTVDQVISDLKYLCPRGLCATVFLRVQGARDPPCTLADVRAHAELACQAAGGHAYRVASNAQVHASVASTAAVATAQAVVINSQLEIESARE